MAIVINLGDHRTGIVPRRAAPVDGAQILLFTGVRFERLEQPAAGEGESDVPPPDGHALRNRTG